MAGKYQLRRIAGYGLQARLNDDKSVTMIDSGTSKEIVTITSPGCRILSRFERKTNYRAGENSESKMCVILECLDNVSEMDDYL